MDNEGDGKRLLVVDEKETCVAQFVPENDLEEIWKEPSDRCARIPGDNVSIKPEEFEPTINYLPTAKKKYDHKKATENPLFRRKIVEKQGITASEEHEEVLEPSKEVKEIFSEDMVARKRPTWATIFLVTSCLMNSLYTCLGNRCVWNVMLVVLKVLLAVFIYLVLACATIIVTVLINSHDALSTRRVKFQVPDENQNKDFINKEVEEMKRLPQTSVSKVKIKGV